MNQFMCIIEVHVPSRLGLHGCVLKSVLFHIVAFSNQSALDFVFKCLRFHDRLPRLRAI